MVNLSPQESSSQNPSVVLQIQVDIETDPSTLFAGLAAWSELGLLSHQQVLELCATHLACAIPVSVLHQAETLEATPEAVASADLASPEPLPAPISGSVSEPVLASESESTSGTEFEDDFVLASSRAQNKGLHRLIQRDRPLQTPAAPTPPEPGTTQADTPENAAPNAALDAAPGWMAQRFQAFMEEISVIWLLMLGVFMVVVSSGVLAASQWQNFSPSGQYLVLLLYTLMFWGAKSWTARRSLLRLTTQMLQMATLLLIPINFWMMDTVLLSTGRGWAIATLAALGLTLVLGRELRTLSNRPGSQLLVWNGVGLSWLHWGWGFAAMPLLASYAATLGTAAIWLRPITTQSAAALSDSEPAADAPTPQTVSLAPNRALDRPSAGASDRRSSDTSGGDEPNIEPDAEPTDHLDRPSAQVNSKPIAAAATAIALSLLLLMVRAIWIAQVPFAQLGLAIGLCGSLLCWQFRWAQTQLIWRNVGAVLLILGWGATVFEPVPWQAIAISVVILGLLADRLQRLQADTTDQATVSVFTDDNRERSWLLLGLTLGGLQTYVLVGRLIPPSLREQSLAWLSQQVGASGLPLALIGLLLFPYGLIMLVAALACHRRQWFALGRDIEFLTLGFIALLIVASIANPLIRSLVLTGTCGVMATIISQRQPAPKLFFYLLNGLVVSTSISWTQVVYPNLGVVTWSIIILGAALIEWGGCLVLPSPTIRQTAWPFGLGLATLSAALLLVSAPTPPYDYGWLWLSVPLALTTLSYQRRFSQSEVAIALSTAAALFVQILAYGTWPSSLSALGLMSALMVVNTRRLPIRMNAMVSVGLGCVFIGALGWRILATDRVWWLLLLPGLLWGLWLLEARLHYRDSPMAQVYTTALNTYAEMLASGGLLGVTVILLTELLIELSATDTAQTTTQFTAFFIRVTDPQLLLTLLLTLLMGTGAIAYRLTRRPTEWRTCQLAIALETLLISTTLLTVPDFNARFILLALANIALGLATQIGGDFWQRRRHLPYPTSWHGIPLSYGIVGLLFAHLHPFHGYTGLYTLGAALVGVGVGRRRPSLKPVVIVSILLVSAAAYELVFYPLSQASGGDIGDGLVILSALAAAIALGMRLLSRWLPPYLNLRPAELRALALGHWGLGFILLLASLGMPRSFMGGLFWVGVASLLTVDALWEGRTRERFTYAGIVTLLGAFTYSTTLIVPETSQLLPWVGAIALLPALGFYKLPWRSWGWSPTPWLTTALGLPLAAVAATLTAINISSLLLVAAYYALIAWIRQQPRLSYISIILADWSLGRWLLMGDRLTPFFFALILGVSLLYVAQFDPGLQPELGKRSMRHQLRLLAIGLIDLAALYEAETQWTMAAIALGFNVALIGAGLALRVRAYLFVGTIAFIYQVLRQLGLLISTHSLLIWAVGIVLGLLFIWIAATFEARRSQAAGLMQHWLEQLETWE